jgi:hypothetical protein
MPRRLRTALVAGCLALAPQAAPAADAGRYAEMAESMVQMMDAFSDAYGKRRQGPASSAPMSPSPWGGNPLSSSPWGSSPWGFSPMSPLSAGAMPWGGAPFGGMPSPSGWAQWPGGQAPWGSLPQGLPNLFPNLPPPPPGPLDGIWLGQSGEVLVVRQGRFRIHQDPDSYREGQFRLQGDRLAMLDPESGHVVEYDMIHEQDHLALRDPRGGILLYRLLLRGCP